VEDVDNKVSNSKLDNVNFDSEDEDMTIEKRNNEQKSTPLLLKERIQSAKPRRNTPSQSSSIKIIKDQRQEIGSNAKHDPSSPKILQRSSR